MRHDEKDLTPRLDARGPMRDAYLPIASANAAQRRGLCSRSDRAGTSPPVKGMGPEVARG